VEAGVGDRIEVEDQRTPVEARASRAPYVPPALKVYGAIAALTRTVGMKGTVSDGGGAPGMSKTS
jgi:hypothetical protein